MSYTAFDAKLLASSEAERTRHVRGRVYLSYYNTVMATINNRGVLQAQGGPESK